MVSNLYFSSQEFKTQFIHQSMSMLPFNPVDVNENTVGTVKRFAA